METNEFVSQLKNKFGYSDEMEQFLLKAIPAIISYYGEDKRNIIYATLNDCEIHIQKENENTEEYVNQYFGTNKKRDLPFLAGGFQDSELSIKDGQVHQKNIIYMKTMFLDKYKPFDFNDDAALSGLIHEMCHAIKSYDKLKVENGKVVTSSGLIKEYFDYDKESGSFERTNSTNVGIEEALNSYDEASVMTIMTGVHHEYGAYKPLTPLAEALMKHEELARIIKMSQFSGGDEWIEFLGKEQSDILIKNLDDWVNIFYLAPKDLDLKKAMETIEVARKNLLDFINNYNSPQEIQAFMEARKIADQKTMEAVKQVVSYNSDTNEFEEVKAL